VDNLFNEGGDSVSNATEDFIASQFMEKEQPNGQDAGTESSGDADKDGASKTGQDGSTGNAGDDPAKLQQKQTKPGDSGAGGDLLDKDGNLVARAGVERRWYQQFQDMKRNLPTIEAKLREFDQLKAANEAYKSANAFAAQHNLNADQITLGMKMTAALRDNPAQFAQWVLTQVKTMGHNIDGISPTVDVNAIKQIISEQLKPFIEDRSAVVAEEQQVREAEQARTVFYERYPDAAAHQDILEAMMERADISAIDALTELRVYAAKYGFDFSQPLAPQIEALEAQKQKPATTQAQALPNGRPLPAGTNVQDTSEPTYASTAMSYEDIVKQEMRKNGLVVDW